LNPSDLWFGYNADDLYRYDGDSLFELKLPRKDLKKAFGIEPEGVPFKGLNNTPYAVFGVNKDKVVIFGLELLLLALFDTMAIHFYGLEKRNFQLFQTDEFLVFVQ
jgi:hypothetical protein